MENTTENTVEMKTELNDVLENTIIPKTFKITLHDGTNGASDEDSTKLTIFGKFDIGKLTLEHLINKAISSSVISYQNKNRTNFDLKDRQSVDIVLTPAKAKLTNLEKTTKIANKMTNDERLALIEKIKAMSE